ncbi:hypothetical protein N657DRAFT_632653 [Parathielavia appendiculata]|uniref:Uncharacterized protein n=1 Tax=Parathielavia appendiculata TaxID=2587402 RepID=A0AAN6U532_9PEZI|nr:hypothetical protein N657DRAFT_632653 [Parathielavia appendiculata]
MADKSLSRQQWILQKERDQQDNEALDKGMLYHGLEDVTAHLLRVYDEAREIIKGGGDLLEVGNLNARFVDHNIDRCLVSADVFARTTPHRYLHDAWKEALPTDDGARGILFVDDLKYSGIAPLGSQLSRLLEKSTPPKPPVIVLHHSVEKAVEYLLQPTAKVPAICTVPLRYTEDDVLALLTATIKEEFGDKEIQGGWDGASMAAYVQRLTRNRGLKSRGNVQASVEGLKQRRAKRTEAEERMITAWTELREMIGMEQVKESVRQLLSQIVRSASGPSWSGSQLWPLCPTAAAFWGLPTLISSDATSAGMRKPQRKATDEARGGVLIIDDFHLLLPDNMHNTDRTDVFRAAVIDTMVANVDPNSTRKEAVILVGHSEFMTEAFEKTNPGLTRRFRLAQTIRFEPYSDRKLTQILHLKLRKHSLVASDTAVRVAEGIFPIARHRPSFGKLVVVLAGYEEDMEKLMGGTAGSGAALLPTSTSSP